MVNQALRRSQKSHAPLEPALIAVLLVCRSVPKGGSMRANFKVMIVLALVCGGGAVWAGGRWLDAASAARLREIEAERPAVSF
ncbi:MAG TPA: hypothetical protein PKD41_17190, partial [Solidesulfovibrio sp.]|nr:hypothetical protein [Solidesulfovibrio sp.]